MLCKLSLTLGGILMHVVAQTFTNPILWEDPPDNEFIRVGDVFFMTASSFHLSPLTRRPHTVLLRFGQLGVDWEFCAHLGFWSRLRHD